MTHHQIDGTTGLCMVKAGRCRCVKPAGHLEAGDAVHACDPYACKGSWVGSYDLGQPSEDFDVITYPGGATTDNPNPIAMALSLVIESLNPKEQDSMDENTAETQDDYNDGLQEGFELALDGGRVYVDQYTDSGGCRYADVTDSFLKLMVDAVHNAPTHPLTLAASAEFARLKAEEAAAKPESGPLEELLKLVAAAGIADVHVIEIDLNELFGTKGEG